MNQRRSAHLRRQASVDYPRYPPQSAAQAQLQQPHQHIPQPSDYESDNPAYLSDFPIESAPTTRTNDELNLSVLKRHNTAINSILSIAPYAVVYEFSPLPEPLWSKTGVEGSLFVCKLEQGVWGEDRYTAIVLNRRGLDNFEAELREGDNAGVEITDDYVIISFKQVHEQKIYGIFIFSEGSGTSTEQTRVLNGDLMKQLAIQAGVSRQAAELAAAEATAAHTNGHMQEAESAADSQGGAPMGRQISLQQLFGQQRADDASWSVRNHGEQNAGNYGPQPYSNGNQQAQMGAHSVPPHQNDVLGNLFRGL